MSAMAIPKIVVAIKVQRNLPLLILYIHTSRSVRLLVRIKISCANLFFYNFLDTIRMFYAAI